MDFSSFLCLEARNHPFTFLHFHPSEDLKAPAVLFLQENKNYGHCVRCIRCKPTDFHNETCSLWGVLLYFPIRFKHPVKNSVFHSLQHRTIFSFCTYCVNKSWFLPTESINYVFNVSVCMCLCLLWKMLNFIFIHVKIEWQSNDE